MNGDSDGRRAGPPSERLECEEAAGQQTAQSTAERLKRLREIASRVNSLPVLDDREPDEIIGYDDNGLPR